MIEGKTIPQIIEEAVKWNKELLEILEPAMVNIAILEGDISVYQSKKRQLIDEVKTLELNKTNIQNEINQYREEKKAEADKILTAAHEVYSKSIKEAAERKEILNAAEVRRMQELRNKAMDKAVAA